MLIALPIIFTAAIVYSAYSGVKKITPYTPNKDDVVSSKKSASQVKIDTPEIDKSVENSRGQDGPHVTKYKKEQQQLGSFKGRCG